MNYAGPPTSERFDEMTTYYALVRIQLNKSESGREKFYETLKNTAGWSKVGEEEGTDDAPTGVWSRQGHDVSAEAAATAVENEVAAAARAAKIAEYVGAHLVSDVGGYHIFEGPRTAAGSDFTRLVATVKRFTETRDPPDTSLIVDFGDGPLGDLPKNLR